jgi:pyridoxine 5-phosphate synthase
LAPKASRCILDQTKDIHYQDVYDLKENIHTEFNIEGNPKEQKFVDLVLATKPAQVTLVPDAQNQLTSDHGWDTITEKAYLTEIIGVFKAAGIRVSIFVNPSVELVKGAAKTGTDRIELYTEAYAKAYANGERATAIMEYKLAATAAKELGLGINAGHDLDRFNLAYLVKEIPFIDEVSIGHALICDALYLGLENTIQLYKRALDNTSL